MSSLKMLDAIIASLYPAYTHVDDARAFLLSPSSVPTHPRGRTLSRGTRTAASSALSSSTWPARDAGAARVAAHLEWDADWNTSEIQREEIRRICWSSLKLCANHLGFNPNSAQYLSGISLIQSSKVCHLNSVKQRAC